ncbi:hypothetical protein B0H19DRAFT_1253350 [Mycena capillaripes]|nr:hypothetical protein B0H19DRAFT_1253350 [Mycena capillaripes]
MSLPARKDAFRAMIMHKVPPHLSPKEFEAKMEALIDEAVLLPPVQKNLLKVEIIFQTDVGDEHVTKFGFPLRDPVVFVTLQSETVEHLVEVLEDAEVQKIFEKGKEFGLHSGSYGFSANVVAKIDRPAPPNAAHLICVYNVPPHVSTKEHDQDFEGWIDNFLNVPGVQKAFVRFEMWQHNRILDDHIRAFGYSAAGPAFVHHAQVESLDGALEMLQDIEAHQFVLNAGQDFALLTDGYVFTGHVVTKIDRSV